MWCENGGVPIFSHCTPKGFEAGKDYGKKSADPELWRPVLSRHPRLRLCLAHTGGGEGWFAPDDADFERSFAGKAYRLACDFPNVYCDFGMLDEVLEPRQLEHFERRLQALLRATPDFGNRMCYGSDWHMLYRELQSDEYLNTFEKIFEGELESFRERFFHQNALRYLGRELVSEAEASHNGDFRQLPNERRGDVAVL